MIGLIAGVASAASGIAGAVRAKKARKKAAKEQRRILDQLSEENESNFLRDYYRNAFDDPTSRSYLKRISGKLYDQEQAMTNSGIATGATHENTLAKKQAAKDQYMQQKKAIASGKIGVAEQEGEDMAKAAQQIAGGVSVGFGNVGNLLDKSGWLK